MEPSLPQDDQNIQQRQEQLTHARGAYQFNYAFYNLGFADTRCLKELGEQSDQAVVAKHDAEARKEGSKKGILAKLSDLRTVLAGKIEGEVMNVFVEDVSGGYTPEAFKIIVEYALGCLVNYLASVAVREGHDLERVIDQIKATASREVQKLFHRSEMDELIASKRALLDHMVTTAPGKEGGALTLQDYDNMFQTIPMPEAAKHWDEDWFFAYQTVAGSLPNRIQCVDRLPDNFPITDAMYRKSMGEDRRLDEDIAAKKVFLLDFSLLEKFTGGMFHGQAKFIYAPIALFAWQETTAHKGFGLTPVAIQCGQRPGPDTPIFTPHDGWRWKMARYCVQVATGCLRGSYQHYGIHVLLDRIVVCTKRTLAARHPLHILLAHNFALTLAANIAAQGLMGADGAEATLIAPPLDATVQLLQLFLETFSFDKVTPPNAFKDHGVDDPRVLPMYPFREDTTKLWEATTSFVSGYVALYYDNDQRVRDDVEVQDWARLLQAPEGGRLHGVGTDGTVTTVAELARLVAQIIYVASAYHAAINYSGFELFSYAPAIAYAGFAAPPTMSTPDARESFMAMVPPLSFAWAQFLINYEQTSLWQNQLGVYPDGYFRDPRVAPLAQAFKSRLSAIEEEIKVANEKRPLPYVHQIPPRVTASLQC